MGWIPISILLSSICFVSIASAEQKIYLVSADPFLAVGACSTCTGSEAYSARCLQDCPRDQNTPNYEPAYWNDGATVQRNNNCYNYSCNVRTDTFAQPGRASGRYCTSSSCLTASIISQYAVNDGLIKLQDGQECPSDMAKLALVIADGDDYHWYRRDANGYWSHKPGKTLATNLDSSGAIITDPRNANRGAYRTFAGFFCTWSSRQQGEGLANIE